MDNYANEFLTVELGKNKSLTFIKRNEIWRFFSRNQDLDQLKNVVPKYILRCISWEKFTGKGCILFLEVMDDNGTLVYEDSFDLNDKAESVENALNTYKRTVLTILNEDKL